MIKPTHKDIRVYYETLENYKRHSVVHEGAVKTAFQNLLAATAKAHKWTVVPELTDKISGYKIRPDATVRDSFNIPRGYWEAKDTNDDLDAEIRKKIVRGYPLTNTVFEDTRQGVLYQDGHQVLRADLTDPGQLADLLNAFYTHSQPDIDGFEKAVDEFRERVPDLARGLVKKIHDAHCNNPQFKAAFTAFFDLCKSALNPNISKAAVDEMLVQHMLTERLFRTIFEDPDFNQRNVIAVEVEKVIGALVSKTFSKHEFVKSLDRFYKAIENAARDLTDFTEKQHFLNTVYEQFFQGYSVKVADTHGIVYTPQPIVNFMCASVEEVLKKDFGTSLGSKDVHILDPCTGTGNFIVNLLRRVPKQDLPRMYREQLFANEVMLMPYYISALNIEHAYYEITGQYEPFNGLCFVDTLDLVEHQQSSFSFMTEANTARVERQKSSPITIILGNPPYNVGQLNENDNNKNRKYEIIDRRVKESYAKDSKATNKNALSDAYVKFFRWAVDRLQGRDGIVCFVSNNSFVDQIAFDGMRKHLMQDFSDIYHLDLHGNVRKNPKLSGTKDNVFGIQVGVGITVAVRNADSVRHRLHYHRVPEMWRKEQKLDYLVEQRHIGNIDWKRIKPNNKHAWLVPKAAADFAELIPLGTREAKSTKEIDVECLFKTFSNGVKTNRDAIVYNFDRTVLASRVQQFIEDYNSEVDRYRRATGNPRVDDFVRYDTVKWSETLKRQLVRGVYTSFDERKIRRSLYRPFTKQYLFFDPVLNERRYQLPHIFPTLKSEQENRAICLSGVGSSKPFQSLAVSTIPCLDMLEKTQCFPFYIYDETGNNRRDNITNWALCEFHKHYEDLSIRKWDVFYYVYGVLHHSSYRSKYADCLKRELPRIPFTPHFWAFAKAGEELAKLHLDYEQVEPYELEWAISKDTPLSYRVERKMRLKKDKKKLVVNPSLTLEGIPPRAFDYHLGNRSALEWVIDQYQIKQDKRSGIISDPNRNDDSEYIINLIGQVISVSLETTRIVNSFPDDLAGQPC